MKRRFAVAVVLSILLVPVPSMAGEKLSKEEKAKLAERLAASIVGKWKWTAFKATWMFERSTNMVQKDGWTPHGEIAFQADSQYSFDTVDAPKEKRSLRANGTYSVSGGEPSVVGRYKGRPSGTIVLSAASPKQRLTRNRAGGGLIGHLVTKGNTSEEIQVLQISDDELEIYMSETTGWSEEAKVVLALERVQDEKAASVPAPASNEPAKKVEISLGMTEAEVARAVGEPQAKAVLGDKVVYRYETMIITFVGGKVTDVSFR